jgi:hypothetical protein
VRYIDVQDGKITMAKRIKELRYGKKYRWNTYAQLSNAAMGEIKDKDAFPERLRTILGDFEHGLDNSLGWVFQGFIEDTEGELRPQTYEESLNCIGCHSGIGGIVDGTFAFARKIAYKDGSSSWHHWSQKGIVGLDEPVDKEGDYEYSKYLYLNGAADEFRANDEVKEKFFNEDGSLKEDSLKQLHEDISQLLFPSAQRALDLNRAYKVIVDAQRYIYGRDCVILRPQNVHEQIDDATYQKIYSDFGNKLNSDINLSIE